MFKVEFRSCIESSFWNKCYPGWQSWYEIGQFDTLESAMQTVLDRTYPINPEATIENFRLMYHTEDQLGVYEIIDLYSPREWHFRFREDKPKESPWKVGLND